MMVALSLVWVVMLLFADGWMDSATTTMENPSSSSSFLFRRASVRVREDRPSFPSFWNYASRGTSSSPLVVSYDKRSIRLNDTPVLLLGGSAHPIRATSATWEAAMDEAVHNGLNLVTVFVFWNSHQPLRGMPIDWSIPAATTTTTTTSWLCQNKRNNNNNANETCADDHHPKWDLATAIRQAANRGLFVHIRLGPFACGEFNYGGIPEWVPLSHPNMSMRRLDQEWMDVMESYLKKIIDYLTDHKLWAHQGGNIILAQVENELYDNDGVAGGANSRSMQDYADWSGAVAHKLAPHVVWTMCMGLTAPNTINTCDGFGDCATSYLENYGQTGRIQKDQPAMFSEAEMGFQVWGETPTEPTFYLWGRRARDTAFDAVRWFARGGSHHNYYMFWGGYNRGRRGGAGVANLYANDAPLCSSGQRHQPKFSHFQSLHYLMAEIASTLLSLPTALKKEQPVQIHDPQDNVWKDGTDQRLYVYAAKDTDDAPGVREVVFVENDGGNATAVKFSTAVAGTVRTVMQPYSAKIFVDGAERFDSSAISAEATRYTRLTTEVSPGLSGWSHLPEPIGPPHLRHAPPQRRPIEQTKLMVDANISTDYAWYETVVFVEQDDASNTTLSIETHMANAFVVFWNHQFVGAVDHHVTGDGTVVLSLELGPVKFGRHTLTLLSESLGYFYLIGNPGFTAQGKVKGITGMVNMSLSGPSGESTIGLVEGTWWSAAGLYREQKMDPTTFQSSSTTTVPPCTWSQARFTTPSFDSPDQSLFLDITTGRGHVWLNGYDLGRFWNITRGNTTEYSQRYYLLPRDIMRAKGKDNNLLFFNAMGGDYSTTKLVVSQVVPDANGHFPDEVAYLDACI